MQFVVRGNATFSMCCLDFRFDDASYYYWILSMQDLDSAKTAADPREVHPSTLISQVKL
jgi:hypothetical protein